MENKLLHVYPKLCTACKNCEIACSFSHPAGGKPTPTRIMTFLDEQKREGKNEVVVCLQCDTAACVAACPSHALQRNPETGVIVHVRERCIRCSSCVAACPFGNMHWIEADRYPAKCDHCQGDPLCVKFCPVGAIRFV